MSCILKNNTTYLCLVKFRSLVRKYYCTFFCFSITLWARGSYSSHFFIVLNINNTKGQAPFLLENDKKTAIKLKSVLSKMKFPIFAPKIEKTLKNLSFFKVFPIRSIFHRESWCEEWDLNPHGFLHTPLKRTRLPVPPSSQAKFILQYFFKKVKLIVKKFVTIIKIFHTIDIILCFRIRNFLECSVCVRVFINLQPFSHNSFTGIVSC